ncbi:FAD-binding oxidoreductase [Ammoniphilus sp. CFH 90114]|uniref:NAD(P)/FAD-dependent oxidoreductase n=1 Tax=Ammoniphilus sp. CFH 90114 TaxID=2493665 RepID=UPI00100E0599|nr:FAD-dependent oxidoreductase [Ammoniphilus sp. CFH 90114]RXT06303.1 FAD-binding oxidoreductase [Ammoniphilus sp. CFH 90114]
MELQHGLDLKNGPLSWLDTLPSPPTYPQLEEDIVCDVLVIGGGEAGSLCAYHLAEQQVDTVIVDRRRFGFGSTSANTGLLQFANDKELTACINTFGEEKGVRFYKLCQNAVSEIGKLCNKLKIFPDYVSRDSLYYATSIEDVPSLQKEYLTLKKHGFPVRYMKEEEIREKYSFSKPAAIFATGDADINPYKFANSLIYSAVDFGLRAYQETEIVSRETEKDHVVLYTKNRKRIKARKVIFATGYETQIQLQNNANAVLSSSYAIVTQPIEEFTGWPDRCLIWETARPYLYIRTSVDNRIIAGGFDEPMVQAEQRDARLIHKRDLLVQAVQELFPSIPNLRADYYWSATFGGTHDGYPLIGEQPEYPHCYFALGYGGNGTVYSMIAAQIITSLITQGTHQDADLFRFNRAPYQTSNR